MWFPVAKRRNSAESIDLLPIAVMPAIAKAFVIPMVRTQVSSVLAFVCLIVKPNNCFSGR